MRNSGVLRILLISTLLFAPGCLDTRSGRPNPPNTKPVFVSAARIPGLNAPPPDQWDRVFIGELPRPHLEGYMRTRTTFDDDRALVLHWVYDNEFRLTGVITDNGKTTRFDQHGKPTYVGALKTDEGLLAIFGHEQLAPVHFVPMPAPAE